MPTVTKQSPNAPISKSVLDRIAPIGFSADDGIKILIYGKSATGKTTLCGTFPGPILFIICSGGDKPGELRSIDTLENRKRISQVVLEHTSEMREIVKYIKAEGKFKSVVLDHASGMQDLTLKEILGIEELPAQKTWGLATQAQWGQSTMMCKEMFRQLLSLPTNVAIIAQERTFGGSDDANLSDMIHPTVGAALTPSLTGWLGPACDYVVQTYLRAKTKKVVTEIAGEKIETIERDKGIEYCVRTEAHEVFQTKFRVPRGTKIPDAIVDPTYDKILRLIRGQ